MQITLILSIIALLLCTLVQATEPSVMPVSVPSTAGDGNMPSTAPSGCGDLQPLVNKLHDLCLAQFPEFAGDFYGHRQLCPGPGPEVWCNGCQYCPDGSMCVNCVRKPMAATSTLHVAESKDQAITSKDLKVTNK